MSTNLKNQHTGAWRFQVWASFLLSVVLTLGGIFYLPVDFWMKGYLGMGILFMVGSCCSLAKTIRDDHEAQDFVNRVQKAKTEKILTEFES